MSSTSWEKPPKEAVCVLALIAAFVIGGIYMWIRHDQRQKAWRMEQYSHFNWVVDGATGKVHLQPKSPNWRSQWNETQRKYGKKPLDGGY